MSGIGKGLTASSLGVLFKSCGWRVTSIKIDPYVKITLSKLKKAPKKKSKTIKKSGKNPNFNGEMITFDCFDPNAAIVDNDINMHVEIWDDNLLRDALLGFVDLSVCDFMSGESLQSRSEMTFVTCFSMSARLISW